MHCFGIGNHSFISNFLELNNLKMKNWSFLSKLYQNVSIKLIHWLCQSFNLYINYLSKYTTSSHNYITCSFLNRIKVRVCGCARDYICHDFAFLLPWIFYVNTIYMYVYIIKKTFMTLARKVPFKIIWIRYAQIKQYKWIMCTTNN